MALTIFYIAAAIAVLLIGAGVFWASWQVAKTLTQIRQTMLPQLELTLTEVQKNLNNIEDLTQDVDSTVEEATQLVQTANRTVQSVEDGIDSFNRNVAVPFMIRSASLLEGVKAGLQTLRSKSLEPSVTPVAAPGSRSLPEPVSADASEVIEALPR